MCEPSLKGFVLLPALTVLNFIAHCYIAGLCMASAFDFHIPVVLRLSILFTFFFSPQFCFQSNSDSPDSRTSNHLVYALGPGVEFGANIVLIAFRSQTRYSVSVRRSP